MKEEGCLMWEQSKTLAKERGLEMTGSCPVSSVCKGTQCVYLSTDRQDIDRLVDLRNELTLINMRNNLQKLTKWKD